MINIKTVGFSLKEVTSIYIYMDLYYIFKLKTMIPSIHMHLNTIMIRNVDMFYFIYVLPVWLSWLMCQTHK